jgi:hypothetical protein
MSENRGHEVAMDDRDDSASASESAVAARAAGGGAPSLGPAQEKHGADNVVVGVSLAVTLVCMLAFRLDQRRRAGQRIPE